VAALALGAAVVTPAFADGPITYQVQPGDTLLGIARHYGVSVIAMSTLNSLSDPNELSVGQTLTIGPADTATTSAQMSTDNPPPVTPDDPYFPHYPSFTINPDGIVVRALSHVPPDPLPPSVLGAPYHNQFDGTIWAESNCGPTTLAMALGAFGVDADQLTLRTVADRQMGMHDPKNGTTWESLAYAAHRYGVSTDGLYTSGRSYRTWTLEGLKNELDQRRPVMLLVRFWDLPDHLQSSFAGDHYILALGFDEDGNLIYHDSAMHGDGSYRTISPTQLMKAWTNPSVGLVRTAMAFYR
jgi:murein DD-endopeptidase MepM/ murein hydrolase activator NlpD